MQKKKAKKYDVKKSLMALLLLAVFLIISTYAWFTSNTLVKLETIEVSVETSAGFQISVDAVNWKSIVSPTEIRSGNAWTEHTNHIPGPTQMKPVSTVGTTTDDGVMEMFMGEVDVNENTGILELTSTPSADVKENTDYIAFDLFLRTTQDMDLQLDLSSNVIGGPNTAGQTKGLENSVRVGFVNQGYMPYSEYDLPTGIANARAMKGAEQVIFWEPNSDSHTAASQNDAANSWGVSGGITVNQQVAPYSGVKAEVPGVQLVDANSTDNATLFGDVTPAGAGNYPLFDLIQTEKPLPDATTYPTYQSGGEDYFENFGGPTPAGSTNTVIPNNDRGETMADTVPLKMRLSAGVTKLRIYMWIEGQDYDCQDFASGTFLQYNLAFTIADPLGAFTTYLEKLKADAALLNETDYSSGWDALTTALAMGEVEDLTATPPLTVQDAINLKARAIKAAIAGLVPN